MTLRAPNEPTDAFTPLGPAVKPAEPKPSPPPPRAPQPGTVPVDMADIGMIMRDGSKPAKAEPARSHEWIYSDGKGYPGLNLRQPQDDVPWGVLRYAAAHGFAPGFVPPAGMNDVMDYGSECVRRAMAER